MGKFLLALAVAAAAGGGGWWFLRDSAAPAVEGASALVKTGGFKVSITELGTFSAKDSMVLQVQPEVFGGTLSITKLVEAGAAVKKGDVLMEFDLTEIQRQLSQAEIELQAARNDVVQATSDLKIQEVDNRINLERATYDQNAAIMALKKWNELEAPKAIQEAQAKITDGENALEDAQTNIDLLKKMKEEDLVADAEVRRGELALQKAKTEQEFNRLALKLLRDYDHPLQIGRLENAVRDAASLLEGRESATAALLAQKESAVLRAESSLHEKESQQEKLKADLEKLKLTAPVDGILLYGDPDRNYWGNESKIAVGEKVNAQTPLLTIPDMSALKVKLSVVEADVNKVKPEMTATVKPEAIPDLSMKAVVKKISAVTSNNRGWDEGSSGKFEVNLDLEGLDARLKPGMKCKVEITVDEVTGALYVPLDAVFEHDEKAICWVLGGGQPAERAVKTGRSSHDFVEILEGLVDGEKVALYDPRKEQ